MKAKQKGYTIIEVMIFLAISGALFTISVIGVGAQQNRLRFKSSMEDIEIKIRSTLNNVDEGYSAKANNDKNYTCVGSVNAESTTNSTAECVFIGREINLCSASDTYIVSKVAPYNNGDYVRKDASIAGVIDADKESFYMPGGVSLTQKPSNPNCRIAALYQTLGVSNNRVPRYQAISGGTFSAVDDADPLELCFHDTAGSGQWALITVTQADVKLEVNVPACNT